MFVAIDTPPAKEHNAASLGGKGYGLMRMKAMGLKVPPALILPTHWCANFRAAPEKTYDSIRSQLPTLKAYFQKAFGYMPLLSVRSGARVSMPGMMDTILNVGLDASTLPDWVKRLGKDCVVNSHLRLIEMYGSVVNGIPRNEFHGKNVEQSLTRYYDHVGQVFPDTDDQIIGSILAVFRSWDNDRAKLYRQMHNIPDSWGTAVTLQAMVFGNLDNKSCTGVLFSRNPDTGEPGMVGEYLVNAQGEDVVAGTATPKKIDALKKEMPSIHAQLIAVCDKLEEANKDVQDIEFTVESGTLYVLQSRNAKRSAVAAVRTAVDMYHEKLINQQECLSRVSRRSLDMATQKTLAPNFKKEPWAVGIPACSGIVTGIVVHSSGKAVKNKGKCILVAEETTPDDLAGMDAAVGVLTMKGGATSHAAVVARGMNRACVVGLGMKVNFFKEGSTISLDGATGRVWAGEVPVIDGSNSPVVREFKNLMLSSVASGRVLKIGQAFTKAHAYIHLWDLFPKAPDAVYAALRSAKTACLSVIVDFRAPEGYAAECFMSLFAIGYNDWCVRVAKRLAKDAEQLETVSYIGAPQGLPLTPVGTADDLASLVMAQGVVVVKGDLTPAAKKVLALKKAAGESLEALKVGAPLAPGEDGRAYLSEQQAIDLLLK